MQEIWLDVPGFESIYQISSCGRIQSLPQLRRDHRCGTKAYPGRVLKVMPDGRVSLKKEGKVYHGDVARIVLETFVGPCPPGMQCCHYDDDPMNNHVTNLRWGLPIDNAADRERNGRTAKGEKSGAAKLREGQVLEARRLRSENPRHWTYQRLAERYHVWVGAIYRAVVGKTWAHLPKVSNAK